MSLQIVYGKAGSGKSHFCFEEIKKKIEKKESVIILTPEQFSYTAEKKLLECIDTSAVFLAEVLTFQRMAYRAIQEYGGRSKKNLSETGKAMLIFDILQEEKKNLTFLGKSDENVEMVAQTITEFKKHGIETKSLMEAKDEISEDPYLQYKLKDMVLLYEKYQDRIASQYLDENDLLSILYERLDDILEYDNVTFYFDSFSGFTNQESQVLRKLMKKAKDVIITVTADGIEESLSPESDVFYPNKQTIQKLYEIAREEKIPIKNPIYLGSLPRFQSKELLHLEENLFQMPYQRWEKEIHSISLFLAANPYSEIEEVAKQIAKLVKEENYRYRDISIITKNMDTYASLAKVIFAKYNIPVFIDEKRDLNQNVLIQYVLSILEVFSQNWSYEAVFAYIKSGFLEEFEEEEIFKLESYCRKWGIKGKKWYAQDWNYGVAEEKDKSKRERLNEIRKQIVMPLMDFKERIERGKTVETISKELYSFLLENKIPEKLEKKIEQLEKEGFIELTKEYQGCFNTIMDLLDEMVLVFGKKKITYEKYSNLLKVGLKSSGLGKIPATQDQVIMGDVERSRTHNVKAIFIIGLNDGQFPSVRKEEGFFNDHDREVLKEKKIELAKGTIENLYEDNFNIYKAFSSAENKLYLSYSSADSEGKSLRGSILLSRIKKMFPNLKEESDMIEKKEEIISLSSTFEALLSQLNAYQEGEEIDPVWFSVYQYYQEQEEWKQKLQESMKALHFSNVPETIEKDKIDRLYGETLKTSVSRLETYRKCPFSFYLKYGLKLAKEDTFQVRMVDTGSFMHEVIDSFFETIKERKITIEAVTEEVLKALVDEIMLEKLNLSENYIFTSNAKFRNLTQRLRKVITKSLQYILQSLRESKFTVYGTELEFKDGKTYPSIRMELENGKKVEITGKIDRVDIARTEEGNYLRIIDYKSSIKNIDLNEVVAGLQLQLLTYLDAVSEKLEDVIPAGVLYFSLMDPIVKADRNKTEEEIEEEIKKRFKMNGLILADVKVAKMMDTNLESGASSIVPAYIDKSGNLSKSKSSAVTREQFEDLERYMKKLVKEIASEILEGKIGLTPYYNVKNKKTPCSYCEYQPICQFNPSLCHNTYRYIGKENKQEMLEKIQEETKRKDP